MISSTAVADSIYQGAAADFIQNLLLCKHSCLNAVVSVARVLVLAIIKNHWWLMPPWLTDNQRRLTIFFYRVYRSYEVQSSLTLIPCLDAAHRYCLFPLPILGRVRGGFFFPVPRSLFPKIQKLCTS
ncbi:hypothetical protein [Moorena sp. SIO4G3]|uniref:hypothetical protein n=1 Tax=Moorena sp. SIO4G3 TaxID=2607821 RepID=UPI00142937AB|nr:hypothetical protein [Moorena sp. SIO4G3]NEO80997.1 hypothetical protein [Moorena sp. SIO4G3]